MHRKMGLRKLTCTLAAAATLAGVVPAYAQTQGMERRDERRDDRAGARATKQACKAGDEKTRAECRQMKHGAKQAGRQDGGKANGTPPAPGAPPAQ